MPLTKEDIERANASIAEDAVATQDPAAIDPTDGVPVDEAPFEVTGESSIRDRLEVHKPDDFEWLDLFMYGESGIGKTYFLGTAEDLPEIMLPFLIVDCEGGTKTLANRKHIDVRRARTIADLEKIHNDLFMHNKGWYKGVAIDPLNEVQDIDMRQIMKETKANAKNPDNIDIDVPSPREYGKGRNHVRVIVRGYRDLPMHTFFTCLDQEIVKEGKPDRTRPNLPGKLQGEIPAFVDVCGYYYKRKGDNKRVLQFAGTNRVIAKTRFSELGDVMEEPSIPKIWEKIQHLHISNK